MGCIFRGQNKESAPEDVTSNSPLEGATCQSSDPAVVRAMEYWNDGLELSEGFLKAGRLHKSVLPWALYIEYPVRFFALFQSSTPPSFHAHSKRQGPIVPLVNASCGRHMNR